MHCCTGSWVYYSYGMLLCPCFRVGNWSPNAVTCPLLMLWPFPPSGCSHSQQCEKRYHFSPHSQSKGETVKQGLNLGEFYPVRGADILSPQCAASAEAATPSSPAGPLSLDESPITTLQRSELSELNCFSSVFNLSDRNTGKCTLIKQHIRTGDHPPTKQTSVQCWLGWDRGDKVASEIPPRVFSQP